jgi:uncharacterized DUF497 family protein
MAIDISECVGFQWNKGNSQKNWDKHQVTGSECEQVFFNQPLLVKDDISHSKTESRYYALGRTDANRQLFLVFTVRENLVRVISARDMSQRERKVYEKIAKV